MSRKKRPWEKGKSHHKRTIATRNQIDRFLIVCEGEKTEPLYFESFPVDPEKLVVVIRGDGKNTDSLVQDAIELKQEALREGRPFNQVWCVFDRDSFPAEDFNTAIRRAYKNKLRVAYSNEAFELWYLLHFECFFNAMHRSQYQNKLSALLGHKYEKNSDTMYQELLVSRASKIPQLGSK